MRPSFLEQYGWVLGAATLAVLGVGLVLLKWFRRQQPVSSLPPGVVARAALEPLRDRSEDAALIAEVSKILRKYVIAAFLLPPDELTTPELQRALRTQPEGTAELAAAIIEFLRRCDEWKFAPVPSGPLGAVKKAVELIEAVEVHQREATQPKVPA